MSTTNKWLIGIGIVALLAAMFALPFVLQGASPAYGAGYGMMGGGMMGGGRGMMGGGGHGGMMNGGMMYGAGIGGYGSGLGYIFMWLVPLALVTLFGLSIAALIKYLRSA